MSIAGLRLRKRAGTAALLTVGSDMVARLAARSHDQKR